MTKKTTPTKNQKKHKILAIVLYLLPVLFFLISYFLLTTSGEDIHQGAGSFSNGAELNAIRDMSSAFTHSGRITDMYAWAVIDLYDYQFSFGVDFFLRLLDVLLISGCFYLTTFIILGRKPKLEIKDASIFCASFVAVVLSMFGRRLYSEFSMIHNYVPLVFITLLFSIPYLKLMQNQPTKKSPLFLAICWLPLGFLFGMSTTITPLAFLFTVIIYCIIKRKSLPKFSAWFFTGLIGLIIGSSVSLLLSSGMSDYTNPVVAETFDYVSLSNFLANPLELAPKLLFHLAYNFGIVLIPLIILASALILFSKSFHLVFVKHPLKSLSPNTKRLLISFPLFIFIHIAATVQIQSPPRILIPAYFAGVILLLKIFTPRIKSPLFNYTALVLAIIAVLLHTVFLSIYHTKTASILQEIHDSPLDSLCIDASRNEAPRIPLINLSQEFMLVDWGYPEPIFDKAVTICK